MVQADPPKEASTFERMNNGAQLLSSNMTNYFKKCERCFEKLYCLYENLILQINPPNNSCSQKQQRLDKKTKAYLSTSKEQLFGGSSFSESLPSKSNVYYCSSTKFTLLNE